jgi:hypothetical protein
LAAETLHSVKQELEDIEVVHVEEDIEGTHSVGYDLLFYCLDFIVEVHKSFKPPMEGNLCRP